MWFTLGYTFTQFVSYTLKRDYGDDYVTRFFKFEDCEKLKKAPFEGEIVGSFILNKKQYGFISTIVKHLLVPNVKSLGAWTASVASVHTVSFDWFLSGL